tara:strand:- start:1166 stop:1420 length:255 start_codon:yes stop_codon:yes gene_type:complete
MSGNFFDWIFDSINLLLRSPEKHTKIFRKKNIPKGHRINSSNKKGEIILCPKCFASTRVYNFGWSSLKCHECATNSNKYKWLLS